MKEEGGGVPLPHLVFQPPSASRMEGGKKEEAALRLGIVKNRTSGMCIGPKNFGPKFAEKNGGGVGNGCHPFS